MFMYNMNKCLNCGNLFGRNEEIGFVCYSCSKILNSNLKMLGLKNKTNLKLC